MEWSPVWWHDLLSEDPRQAGRGPRHTAACRGRRWPLCPRVGSARRTPRPGTCPRQSEFESAPSVSKPESLYLLPDWSGEEGSEAWRLLLCRPVHTGPPLPPTQQEKALAS